MARAKAQKLIRDDVYGDLLERLEMLVGVLLEHIVELDRRYDITYFPFLIRSPYNSAFRYTTSSNLFI